MEADGSTGRSQGGSGSGSTSSSRSPSSRERPITKDAAGCFNIATALEIALRASWIVRDSGRRAGLEPGSSVRVGAGIAFGSKTVCGFMSRGTSAHRWSVFGDGATEAHQLAAQGPGIHISSRALERLQSPSSWGIVHSDTLRRLQRVQGGNSAHLVMPWMRGAGVRRPDPRYNLQREVEQAERQLVSGWRQRMRGEARQLLEMCEKRPMPVDAVAFGATVPATHYYEVPHDRSGEDGTRGAEHSESGAVVWGDQGITDGLQPVRRAGGSEMDNRRGRRARARDGRSGRYGGRSRSRAGGSVGHSL